MVGLFSLGIIFFGWAAKIIEECSLGDIVYLNALGQGIIILDSHRRAVDLLDKRAVNYSDRPRGVVFDL